VTGVPTKATQEVKDDKVAIAFSKLESHSTLGSIFAIILEWCAG